MKGTILTGLKKKARSIMVRRRGRNNVITTPTKARRPGRRYQ
ncbi:hypothetical protein [Micromonospora phytophila]|nr:hypothetical protein [Micromonospora phytophila]